MTYAMLAFAAMSLVGAMSGWFYAWRARGEANSAGDRARIAEANAELARGRAFEAQVSSSTAIAQYKGLEIDLTTTKMALARERADKGVLLEKLAQLGSPVGDALYDSTVDRLYADRDRREASGGQGAGSGPDPHGLPAVAPGPATTSDKG